MATATAAAAAAAASASPLQFCKLFLPHRLSQRLKIPPAFVKHLKALAGPPPVTVSLKGPGGGVWYTDLVTVSGDFFLDAGWKDFIRDHSLEIWDFLVFRYDGSTHFDVLVFDRSTCGKEAALSARPSQDRGGSAAVSAQPSADGGGQERVFPGPSEDTGNVAEEAVLVRPFDDGGNARAEGFSTRTSKDGDREEAVLEKRKRGRPKRHKSDTLLVKPTEATEGRDSVAEETLLVRPTEGGKEDTLPVGGDNEEGDKVIKDSGDMDKDGEETILVRPSEDRGNAGEEGDKVIEDSGDVDKNREETILVRSSEDKGNAGEEGFLARTSEDGDREEAVVDGVIVKRKRGRPKKNMSDDCVVMEAPKPKRGRPRKELIEGQKRTRGRPRKESMEGRKRTRGRPRKNMSDGYVNTEGTPPLKEITPCEEDHFLVKDKRQHGVRSLRRPVTSEEVNKAILKAKAFKSEYPFCVVQMYDSYVYYGFALGIPLKFARKHLPQPGGNVILCDPSGTRWDVKYVVYRRHGCFNAGWLKFSVTNNLETGDVCIFELVKNYELRVHIFRVVEELTPLIRAFQGRRKRSWK